MNELRANNLHAEKLWLSLETNVNDRQSAIECLECRSVFATRGGLQVHLKCYESSTFDCPQCGETFEHLYQLRKHSRKKHSGALHKCSECHKVFKSRKNLMFHSQHHQPPQQSCDRCDRKFYTPMSLALHFKLGHMGQHYKRNKTVEKGRISCPTCGKLFTTTAHLKYHSRQHQPAQFNCSICHAEFVHSSSLKNHRINIHSISAPKVLKCKICHRSFSSQVALSHHFHGSRKFKCGTCGRQFRTSANLNNHVELLHNNRRETSVEQSVYHCAICCRPFGFNCTGLNGLVGHLCAHYQRPLKCLECHQVFNSQNALASHYQKQHSSAEGYLCDICQKRLQTRNGLTMHRRFHRKPPMSCPNCNDKFHSNGLLKLHQLRVHTVCSNPIRSNSDGKDKFGCAICYKRFTKRCKVLRHLTVHNPPAFPCPICQLPLRSDVGLRGHLHRRHLHS